MRFFFCNPHPAGKEPERKGGGGGGREGQTGFTTLLLPANRTLEMVMGNLQRRERIHNGRAEMTILTLRKKRFSGDAFSQNPSSFPFALAILRVWEPRKRGEKSRGRGGKKGKK